MRKENIKLTVGELAAWHTQRNQSQKGVDWHFTAADARIKLKRLYPVIVRSNSKKQCHRFASLFPSQALIAPRRARGQQLYASASSA